MNTPFIFRQLLDTESYTCTYLIADKHSKEAAIIDPVLKNIDQYLGLIEQLGLKLIYAIDTHTHADHITALGALREHTQCTTIMGEYTQADCVSQSVKDGDIIAIGSLQLRAIYTPGHTDESFSFYLDDRVFTGECLLIRGSGRTDFQAGNPEKSWESITDKLFTLPDETLVFPGHDYKCWTVSSIGEEKAHNPRLAGKTKAEYVSIMKNLNLPNPKLMDTAVPANLLCGKSPLEK